MKIKLLSGMIMSVLLLAGCASKSNAENQGSNEKETFRSEKIDNEIELSEDIKKAIALETSEIEVVEKIPSEYLAYIPSAGKIVPVAYQTKDYFGDGGEITKYANVYLPADYDKSDKRYAVLYLMHGIGGSETEWGLTGDQSIIKKIQENLVAKKEIEGLNQMTPFCHLI